MSETENSAPSQYDDLLCRCSLADDGAVPRKAPLDESPDVIPAGKTPLPDPAVYFTDNYDKNVAKTVVAEEKNLVYVRAKSLAEGVQNGDVYVYWAREEELNDPSAWQRNGLLTNDGDGSFPLTGVEPEAVAVATTPFAWTPDAALGGHEVVLIGVLATNDHPNPIPTLRSPLDFEAWIAKRGGVGAFRTRVASKPKPDVSLTLSGDFKYAEGGLTDIVLSAADVPLGTVVSFSLTTPVDGRTISIPPTRVTQNPQTWGTQAKLPANYSTTIVAKISFPQGQRPAPTNSITVRAQVTPPTGSGPVRPVIIARFSAQVGQ